MPPTKNMIRYAIFICMLTVCGCMSETRKAELAAIEAREASSAQSRKAFSDSVISTLYRFEIAAQGVLSAQKQCTSTFDAFMEAAFKGTDTLLESEVFYRRIALDDYKNAFKTYQDMTQASHEAGEAIVNLITFSQTSSDNMEKLQLVVMRMEFKLKRAKATYEHCKENLDITNDRFEKLKAGEKQR